MVTMPCGTFVPYLGLQNHASGMYSTPNSNLFSSYCCTKGLLSSSCSTLLYPGLYHAFLISRQYKDLNHFKQSRSLVVKSERVRIFCTAEEQKSGFLIDDNDITALTKASIYQAIEGINRGIFGITSSKRREIEDLVMELEANNPTPNPTLNLEKVSGCWKLQYSTITILGSKRTKLGLRDFVNLGEFLQIIDVAEGKAVNIIKFSARGLNLLNGQLTIQASFSVASLSKLNIKYVSSEIIPEQLMNLFKKNYDLLLSIFNPEGWLEITYVDDTTMIGRDDKGNIFILERTTNDDQLY